MALLCWNCGNDLSDVPRPISRHEHCKACGEALHCCRLCRNYRTDVTGDCDDERADPPVHKENANFCDYYKPRTDAFSSDRTDRSSAAKTELDALFAGDDKTSNADVHDDDQAAESDPEADDSPEASARAKLDELFGKD